MLSFNSKNIYTTQINKQGAENKTNFFSWNLWNVKNMNLMKFHSQIDIQ